MARIIRKLNPALRAALHMAPGLHYDAIKGGASRRLLRPQGIEKLCAFFDAKRKDLRAPEILANFRAEPGHRAAH